MSSVVITGNIEEEVQKIVKEIPRQMASRAVRASNELRNSALDILSGSRSGRMYGGHQASAPGEPPAAWSGNFRLAWKPVTVSGGTTFLSRIENGTFYAGWLENGTPGGQMAPRPHHERIQNDALPRIIAIYDEPYF